MWGRKYTQKDVDEMLKNERRNFNDYLELNRKYHTTMYDLGELERANELWEELALNYVLETDRLILKAGTGILTQDELVYFIAAHRVELIKKLSNAKSFKPEEEE